MRAAVAAVEGVQTQAAQRAFWWVALGFFDALVGKALPDSPFVAATRQPHRAADQAHGRRLGGRCRAADARGPVRRRARASGHGTPSRRARDLCARGFHSGRVRTASRDHAAASGPEGPARHAAQCQGRLEQGGLRPPAQPRRRSASRPIRCATVPPNCTSRTLRKLAAQLADLSRVAGRRPQPRRRRRRDGSGHRAAAGRERGRELRAPRRPSSRSRPRPWARGSPPCATARRPAGRARGAAARRDDAAAPRNAC